jgi:hypothetical protein
MNDAPGQKKADVLADCINKLIQNLVIKCARSETVWDYYHVGVIGYGKKVGSAFTGENAGQDLVPLSTLANTPARVEDRTKKISDGAGGVFDQAVKFPVWFDPIADGGTPMLKAFEEASRILHDWVAAHPNSFPPMVINITDGEPDVDPSAEANELKNICSSDGNTLLFNIHISSNGSRSIEYPDSETALPDDKARLLFSMSSVLPDYMREMVKQEGIQTSANTRGFAFNANLAAVIRFLDIGTRPQNLALR